jgi:hypothetical protein
MLRRVALVRTYVSEELSASFIRVTRIGELGPTLAVTSNQRTLRRKLCLVCHISSGMCAGSRFSTASYLRKQNKHRLQAEVCCYKTWNTAFAIKMFVHEAELQCTAGRAGLSRYMKGKACLIPENDRQMFNNDFSEIFFFLLFYLANLQSAHRCYE